MLMLLMAVTMVSKVWGQPGGMGGPMGGPGMGGPMEGGPGPGPGKGPGRPPQPKFDMSEAIAITGQVESLGSYRTGSWRSMPGMEIQGVTLKTEQGNIEVFLGPPAYVTEQKFALQKGDILEVYGLKGLRQGKPAFFAAKVKSNNQTLKLLDEKGCPLWEKEQGPLERGGPGPGGGGPGGGGPGGMGTGGMGRGRM